ncbi:mitochondrial inner membrane protease subunit 2 [[Candida] anglica]
MSFFSKLGGFPRSVRTAVITLTWFPVVYTFSNHIYQPCQIKGISMSPTFNPNTSSTTQDVVLVQKFGVKKPGSLSRGDVVMFHSPQDPEKLVTKRIVATQGDSIRTHSPPYPRPEARVPRNHLWVEGDNTFHSIDSNTFGPISQGLVTGKVVAVIWPPSRFGADIIHNGEDDRIQDLLA